MKFLDFFSGIGGFRLGLEMAGHTCKGFIEIDKYAVKSYRAMHNTEGEFYATDITGIQPNNLPEADCYCGGFPCQSFSIAGKRGGFEDTRGTLFFEIMRLAKVRKPKYLFLENVRGLLSHDGGQTFGTIIAAMGECGYDAEWQILNSKDYVPQNRERIFIIGHLRESSTRKVFPIIRANGKTLNELISGSQGYRVYGTEGISCTLAREAGGIGAKTGLYLIKEATEKGYAEANEGDSINLLFPESETRRGRVGKQIAQTLETSCNQGVMIKLAKENGNHYGGGVFDKNGISPTLISSGAGGGTNNIPKVKNDYRIRRLTPKECFRLQGFPDELFEKAAKVNSDSQLYKQAGNSVTVNVIHDIGKRL